MNKSPWTSFPFITLGMLILEWVVVLLSIPLLVTSGIKGAALWAVIGLAFFIFLGFFLQKKSFAVVYNYALQIIFVSLGLYKTEIGVMGVIFLAAWLLIYWLANRVKQFEEKQ